MLQNRVDPFGNIIATSARGAWMGNRGLLHNEDRTILRPFRLKAWITCLLQFRERKRTVMSPGRYTELFFLDEATAFSAGHRPCAECRREDYQRFKTAWLAGNPSYGYDQRTSIRDIDELLHRERIGPHGDKVLYEAPPDNLPDGVFVLNEDHPCLLAGHRIFPWSPAGYEKGRRLPATGTVQVLTPASIVNAFRAGYTPQFAVPLTGP